MLPQMLNKHFAWLIGLVATRFEDLYHAYQLNPEPGFDASLCHHGTLWVVWSFR